MLSSSSPDFSPRWLRQFFLISLFTVLTACGGGGGSSSDTGGSSSSSSGGSSGGSNSSSSGGSAPDTRADDFSFTPVTDAIPGGTYTSDTVIISGIDTAVPISVTGGDYSLSDGSGEYTSEAGEIGPNQQLTLRTTAPDAPDASAHVVVTVGEGGNAVVGTYTVTTVNDTTAPTAQILFPPMVSKTEGTTITVRGTVSDEQSLIGGVTVNGVPAALEEVDGTIRWQVSVPLEPDAATMLTVSVTDSAGNSSPEAGQVVVYQGDVSGAFPDDEYEIGTPSGVVIDQLSNRNRLLIVGGQQAITAISLTDGGRGAVTDINPYYLYDPRSIDIHDESGRAYIGGTGEIMHLNLDGSFEEGRGINPEEPDDYLAVTVGKGGDIIAVEQQEGRVITAIEDLSEFRVLSYAADDIPDNINAVGESLGIVYDETASRYLVTDCSAQTVFAVDAETGQRVVLSSNSVGEGASFGSACLAGITVDRVNNRAIVSDHANGRIFAVDMQSGERSVIPEAITDNSLAAPFGLALDEDGQYIFVADEGLGAIMAVDLVTGQRVLISN